MGGACSTSEVTAWKTRAGMEGCQNVRSRRRIGGSVKWIDIAQDKDNWWGRVNTSGEFDQLRNYRRLYCRIQSGENVCPANKAG